jgi:hypothetical protein
MFLQTMGLKVKKNKIIHFSFIKVTKMHNDNLKIIIIWVMDILHINKPKKEITF